MQLCSKHFASVCPASPPTPLGTMAEPGAAAPIMTVPAGTGAPITTMGAMPAYTPATTTGVPIMSSSAAAAAPVISSYGGYGYGGYTIPSALDHSQGKWFMPGEALPPGYVVTAHPEGGFKVVIFFGPHSNWKAVGRIVGFLTYHFQCQCWIGNLGCIGS